MNEHADNDPRLYAIPDIHGHAKGEHKAFADERPIPLSARMLFLWFFHACRRGWPRFMMVTDHMNYLTFEDPAAINLVRRALKLAQAGDLYGAAETASVEVGHAAVVSEGLRRGMRYSIGAEVDNDPRSRPDAQNIVDAMKPDGMIRSVHFLTIDHPTHGPNWNWPFDNPEFSGVFEMVGTEKTWELYMATLLDAIERLPGNIVGHFYVPAAFGHWPDDATLEGYEDQLVDACEARGMAIEVNTRFLYRDHPEDEKAKYLAAHRRLLAKCKAKNVGIAIGSDAHSPKDQGRGFATILALLDECEVNELVFPIAGRLARVALRVERKAEPAAPEPPPAVAAAEDRKPPRKARMSEVPARPKDTSSKRDDAPGTEDAPAPAEGTPAKAKPRPKRSKHRAAAAADETGETPLGDASPAGTAQEDGLGSALEEASADERTVAGTAVADRAQVSETDLVVLETDPTLPEGDPAALEAASRPSPLEDAASIASAPRVSGSIEAASRVGSSVDEATVDVEDATFLEETSVGNDPDDAVMKHTGESHGTENATIAGAAGAAVRAGGAAMDGVADPERDLRADLNDAAESAPADIITDDLVIVETTVEIVTPAEFEPIVTDVSDEAGADPEAASAILEDALVGEMDDEPAQPASAPPAQSPRKPRARPAPARPGATNGKVKSPPVKAKPASKKVAKPASKAAPKSAAKKAATKKSAPVKGATKKSPVKKTPAKKAAPKRATVRATAKKAGAKKTAAKKTGAKKPAQKRR